MSNMAGDSELLQASLAGDKEAFGAVVQRYQSLVCAIAYSATGDFARSEELAQETFLRVWKHLRQLEDLSHFRAWLCTIARNLISQSVRERSGDVLHGAESLERANAVAVAEPDPSQNAIDKELQEIVWAALGRVPHKYREPLVLFYRQQQSVEQVAADLGLSQEAVRQRLHRGRRFIRAEVASLVEDTLARSGPGKVFTVAVVAALPAIVTPAAGAAVAGAVAKGAPATKTVLAAGLSGAILGPIIGLLGGVLGAWCSIRNTNSPRERRFMIQATILLWVLLAVLVGVPLTLVLAGLIPKWVCWVCWAVFFAGLLPLILWTNRRQRRIQIEDGTYHRPEEAVVCLTRSGIYGSFAGSIFGATVWLLILAGLAGHWASFAVILLCDFLIFWGATLFSVRHPERYWLAVVAAVGAIMALTLIAINLCWTAWMTAYRRSIFYETRNDVSLLTINLIVLALFTVLLVLFVTRHVRHRASQRNQTSGRPRR